jgi:glutathione S-transferase
MIALHGFASSNYYNVVKHVLLYKNIPFTEHLIYGGGEEWLAISPVGKIPAITTEDGQHLSETTVICEYLEETYPQGPLYPADAVERARVRQIMKIAELYLELPSRRLISYAFSNKQPSDNLLADVRHVTRRGVGAMTRLCQFDPHIAGSTFSMADIYVLYVNAVVHAVGSRLMDWDIIAEIPGMKDWGREMRSSEFAKRIEADRAANEPEFQAYITRYLQENAVASK